MTPFKGKNALQHACKGFEAYCNDMKAKLNKGAVKAADGWALWKVSCNLSRLVSQENQLEDCKLELRMVKDTLTQYTASQCVSAASSLQSATALKEKKRGMQAMEEKDRRIK